MAVSSRVICASQNTGDHEIIERKNKTISSSEISLFLKKNSFPNDKEESTILDVLAIFKCFFSYDANICLVSLLP